jgi:pyruvate/2-oxoglutarate dehydrogenase complex dihydrolipoamide acyltransferase (E2) component
MEFASRDEAADWIDRNQLGRRNLSRQDYKLLLGRRYNRAKKADNARPGNDNAAKERGGQTVHREKTAEKLAREHGVDEKTVRRAGQYQAAAEKLGIEKEIAAGKVTATEAEVVKAAKTLPPKPTIQQVEEAREELSTPRPRRRASKPAAEVFKAYPPTRCLEAVTFYGQEFLERCPSRSDELRAALVELIASCDATK